MKQFERIAEQRNWSDAQRQAGQDIGFVPTMGALHEGHAELIKKAIAESDQVVVSIFVNPTQFDNPDDLEKYPKRLAEDLALCEELGVAAVFLPQVEEIYPNGYCTFTEVVGSMQESLCAVSRPGHFRGVCTIVQKLFNIVQPQVTVFGQKDLQQVLIIQRMISDLAIPVELMVVPTVREADGLALSSRNARLSPQAREDAVAIPRGLEIANRAFKAGERDSNKLMVAFAEEVLVYENVDMDYADVIDLEGFVEADQANEHCILAVAVWFEGVRLIDHVHLGSPAMPVAIED